MTVPMTVAVPMTVLITMTDCLAVAGCLPMTGCLAVPRSVLQLAVAHGCQDAARPAIRSIAAPGS